MQLNSVGPDCDCAWLKLYSEFLNPQTYKVGTPQKLYAPYEAQLKEVFQLYP